MATKSYKDKIKWARDFTDKEAAAEIWNDHVASIMWGRLSKYTYAERQIILDHMKRELEAKGK